MITVFYDGKCGLCRREIEYYKKIAPINTFKWIDVTVNAPALQENGITYNQALKSLHVLDDQKRLHIGVDGFLVIWRAIPYLKILSIILSVRIINYPARKLYNIFAEWRFSRISYCEIYNKKNDSSW